MEKLEIVAMTMPHLVDEGKFERKRRKSRDNRGRIIQFSYCVSNT